MTLSEKIDKIRKGLNNNAITGDVRKSLEKALENALSQQSEESKPVEPVRVAAKKPSMKGGGSSSAPFSLSNWPLVKIMMPIHQQKIVKGYDEEREAILDDVEKMLSKIPTFGKNDEQVVYGHYFYAQSDWYILEWSKSEDMFFGFTILNGDTQNAELGYISIRELRESSRIELDFYWSTKPLSQVKAEADPDMWGDEVVQKASVAAAPVASKNEYVNQLIAAVKAIEPMLSAYSEDGKTIEGAFRGKQTYLYDVSSGSFLLNKVGEIATAAFRDAVLKVRGEVKPMDIEPIDVEPVDVEPMDVEPVTQVTLPSDCAITRNMKQNGVEIKFQKQPSDSTIALLKSKGFRWSKFQKLWYIKYTESVYQWAIEFCGNSQNSDNPAQMTTAASPNERLITLAVLTKGGKVPQNLLKSEIEAGKLEVARFRRFDGMTDGYEYFKKEEYDWGNASMDLDYYDIKNLKDGKVNTHWSDSIRLNNDDGQIRLGDLTFRYKSEVENADYKPQEQIDQINEIKKIEQDAARASASAVTDLSEAKYWVPYNRPAKKGGFVIENPINPEDYVGKGELNVVLEEDGHKIVGTAEAKNVVTGRMVAIFGNQPAKELRDDLFVFKAEAGTATPGYIGKWSKFKIKEAGDNTDFPEWRLSTFPTSLWDHIIQQSKNAVYERTKMNEKGKSERGKKIHLGKMTEYLKSLNAAKRTFLEYEDRHPRKLKMVTGQSNEEYDAMLGYWRQELGYSGIKNNTTGKMSTLKEVVNAAPNIMVVKSAPTKNEPVVKPSINRVSGKERNINLPNGEKHRGQYAIVELNSILASHNEETFADTPGYPRNLAGNNLNDRNYATDRAAQQLVEDYAQNLNPELLISTNSTPEGTPIINKNGIVVSGNNRTMSLKLAAKKYPEKYNAYRNLLMDESSDFGIDRNVLLSLKPDSGLLKNPVLVRIDYDFGDATTTNMAKYNASSMKAKSPVDKAAELATTLREQILCETNIPKIIGEFDTLSEFYESASAVRRMITAMQQCSVLNEQDMPAYVENGFFTNDGKTLLETILGALILDSETLRIANRDGVKSFRQCVVNALPALIANKNLPAESSLIQYVNEAIRYQGDVVASGLSWENFVNQIGIFDDRKATCNAVYINRLMNQGQKRFRSAIQDYNNSQSNAAESALFQSEIVSPEESFKGYIISRIPAEDTKRIEKYCGDKSSTSEPKAKEPTQAAPADSKSVLETRLKIIQKMLEKKPSDSILNTRLKIVKKMLAQ